MSTNKYKIITQLKNSYILFETKSLNKDSSDRYTDTTNKHRFIFIQVNQRSL